MNLMIGIKKHKIPTNAHNFPKLGSILFRNINKGICANWLKTVHLFPVTKMELLFLTVIIDCYHENWKQFFVIFEINPAKIGMITRLLCDGYQISLKL